MLYVFIITYLECLKLYLLVFFNVTALKNVFSIKKTRFDKKNAIIT